MAPSGIDQAFVILHPSLKTCNLVKIVSVEILKQIDLLILKKIQPISERNKNKTMKSPKQFRKKSKSFKITRIIKNDKSCPPRAGVWKMARCAWSFE